MRDGFYLRLMRWKLWGITNEESLWGGGHLATYLENLFRILIKCHRKREIH